MTRLVRYAEYALAAAGLAAVIYCAAVYLHARHFQADETRRFAARPHTAPRRAPRKGDVVGRLEIPRLGVAVIVVEGADDAELARAAGHIPGTALPGERGNIGIAAHRDTYFRPLARVRPNEVIALVTGARTYRYRVVATKVVRPDDIDVLRPGGRDSLTLVTCYPFRYIGAAPDRFIVRAVRDRKSST